MQNFRQQNTFTEMSNRGVLVVFRHLQANWQLSKMIQDCALSENRKSIYILLEIQLPSKESWIKLRERASG